MQFNSINELLENRTNLREQVFKRMVMENLSFHDIAKKAGIQPITVSRFMRDVGLGKQQVSNVSLRTLIRLAKWMNLLADTLE